MTTEEFKKFIASSSYSEDGKAKMVKLLAGEEEVSPEAFTQIKEIMQAELDKDFINAGVDVSNDPEAKAIEEEYEKTLDEIEAELGKDMAFVETELNELEKLRKQVVEVEEGMAADKIKESIS